MRYMILTFSVCMQLCLGATYSWSLYVQPLRESTGLSQGLVQLPFTLFYFVFPATLFYSSRFLTTFGPRKCAVTGGLLFGGGWIVAGLGYVHFGFTALGVGILAGLGAGIAYIVPITICMHWFPHHKGLVTGVAVAGFGGGAALVTQVASHLMRYQDLSVFSTMIACGATFVLLICVSGLFMVSPFPSEHQQASAINLRQIVNKGPFKLLYGAMLAGLAVGFTVNANLKEIQPVPDLDTGIMAVSLFALANALGRITWGYFFDRLDPARIIQLNLVAQAGTLTILPWLFNDNRAMLAFALLTGFNYGGVLVIYAASVGHVWGASQVGRVYGWLFSANIPAALAPVLAGFSYDRTGTFFPVLISLGAILLFAAWVVRQHRHMLQPVKT